MGDEEEVKTRYPGLYLTEEGKKTVSNDRLMTRMGMSVDDIFKDSFDRETGAVKPMLPGNQGKFWIRVELKAMHASTFIAALAEKLAKLLQPEEGVTVDELVARSVCNTLAYSMFYLAFKENKVQAALEDLSQCKTLGQFPEIKQMVKLLSTVCHEESVDVQLARHVFACTTWHSLEDAKKLDGALRAYPTVLPKVQLFYHSFCYNYLQRHIKDNSIRSKVFSHCVAKLCSVQQQMLRAPVLAETTLLASLHIIRQCLNVGLVDSTCVQQCKHTLKQFQFWAEPFGSEVKGFQGLIERELQAPGSAYLAFQEKEAHVLSAVKSQGTALYWITKEDCSYTKAKLQAMRLLNDGDDDDKTQKRRVSQFKTSTFQREAGSQMTPEHQAMVLLNGLNFHFPFDETEAEITAKLSADAAKTYFQKYSQILESSSKGEIDSEEFTDRLGALKEEVLTVAKLSPGSLVLPDTPPFAYTPPTVHYVLPTPIKFDPSDKEILRMTLVNYIPYPEVPCMERLEQIIFRCADLPKPVDVRIMIAGGDELLHSFLCAYLSLWQHRGSHLSGIDMKFFLVPFASENNHMSAYIARHDSWYHQNVFLPCLPTSPVLPWLTADDLSVEDKAYIPLPGRTLRATCESYVREAQQTVNCFVYQVEGWMSKVETEENKDDKMAMLPDQRIPFLSRIEAGLHVEAKAKNRKLARNEEHGVVAPELHVRFKKMNMRAEVNSIMPEHVGNYSSITVGNVPNPSDANTGSPPDPLRPWLELTANVQKGSAAFNSNNVFVKNPEQHVECVEVQSKNDKVMFSVLIDGRLFGPYTQIRITKIRHPIPAAGKSVPDSVEIEADTPFTFPIQSYFPVNRPACCV